MTLLVHTWSEWPEYEHGFLIPLVSGWLIWQRRSYLRTDGSWLGTGVVLFGALISLVGQLAIAPAIAQYGFVILILGLAFSLIGWQAFKTVAIPLMVLFFMVPLPTFLHISLSNELLRLSSELGAAFLMAIGVPAYLEGNIIDLGIYRLQVVQACNGMRYLLPIVALSFICGFIYQGSLLVRSFITLSGIPLAILMNGFRLGVTGIMVNTWGIGMAEGFMHDFQGWVVYAVCLVCLISEMFVINFITGNGRTITEALQFELIKGVTLEKKPLNIPKPALAAIIPLIVLALTVNTLESNATQVYRRPFSEFPTKLEEWTGNASAMDKSELEFLKPDDYMIVNFSVAKGSPINLYAAYYLEQRITKSIHSPSICLPTNGWIMRETSRIEIPDVIQGGSLSVNRAVVQKNSETRLVYYWFQQAGRSIANPTLAKWFMFSDSVMRGRSDGALVRLMIPVQRKDRVEVIEHQLQQFVQLIYPYLEKHIPD
ncbi:MAG: VPLPA-CTERM-specific exosortase XrtD [Magnetococcales bacterium]|nr:VPLPA-CTERM-specific exosortase XrtD [Magnetococcales bacterium]